MSISNRATETRSLRIQNQKIISLNKRYDKEKNTEVMKTDLLNSIREI